MFENKRSTILFGAGASIPFYEPSLATDYLTGKVLDPKSWEDILRKYKDAQPQEDDIPSATEILGVLNDIKSLYENHGKKINFEQLSEIIDKISSIEYDFAPDSNMLNLLLHTIGAKQLNSLCWKHIPFLFREVIANAILEIKEGPNYNELQELQQGFIKEIMAHDSNVSVVSLNYDECVPKSIDEIDGFDYCFASATRIDGNKLDVEKFLSASHVIYFPHGHLRFYPQTRYRESYNDDINQAEDLRWDKVVSRDMEQCNLTPFAYDFNTFITTGQTKDNAFNNSPFDIYYQRLAKDFAESDTIYFIGYSFGDEHINHLIHGFLKHNVKNKAFVIDKYDKKITMTDEYKDPSNIITKIHATLSAEWEVFVDNNTKQLCPYEKIVKAGVKAVNKIGYGTVFNQVVFYRKGYESFLNEYEAVITEDYHNPRCRLIQGYIDKVKEVIRSCNK